MKRICFLILFACVCSPAFSWNGGGWLQNQTVDDLTVVGDILPAQDNTSDLGSSANSFKNLYIDGNIYGSSGSAIGGWTSATGKIYLTTGTDNVGIGTTSPTEKLEIKGGSLKINYDGKFGVGTTVPTSNLHVVGSGTTSSTSPFRIDNSALTNIITVLDDGNIGIGTTTPTHKFEIDGSIYINDDITVSGNVNIPDASIICAKINWADLKEITAAQGVNWLDVTGL